MVASGTQFSLFLISIWTKLVFITVISKYLNCDAFSVCLISLCNDFALHSGDKAAWIADVLSLYSHFFLQYLMNVKASGQ
jgi:hypothetical protein